jgi:DNA-binding CsgD family transcriptional regulator
MMDRTRLAASRRTNRGPPLVGRARELAALYERLTAALAGAGGLVLIGGEAGIGKTALARALAGEAAAQGALALVGRCYELVETAPYEPWIELFGRYPAGPDLPPLPAVVARCGTEGGVTSQAELFGRVRAFIAEAAAHRPLVLHVEDLHWADPASLELLRFVARRLADLPMLLLVTYRPRELARGSPAARTLPSLVREAEPVRIDLRPLDDDAVGALVATRYALPEPDVTRLVRYLRERAEGNPFFIGELLRALEEDGRLRRAEGTWALGDLADAGLPRLLRQVIEARVGRLPEEAQRQLALAAVIGEEVPLELWAAAGLPEEGLLEVVERADEAGLLVQSADGTRARFAHALTRLALYEGVPPVRRRAWHRRVGEALLGLPMPDPDAVAYHLRQAGDPRAAAWLVRAGERAQRAYAWVTASERYAAALALLERAGAPAGERGWLAYRVGLRGRYHDPRGALDAFERATRLAAEAGDDVLAAYARFGCGPPRCVAGDVRGGLADLEAGAAADAWLTPADRARVQAKTGGDLSLIVSSLRGTLAAWLAMAGRFTDALATGRGALDDPRARRAESGPAGRDPFACLALGWAEAWLGRPDEARRGFDEARELYRAMGHHVLLGHTAVNELSSVVLPYWADRVAERRALAAEAEAAFARVGDVQADFPPARAPCLLARLPLLALEGGEGWADLRRVGALVLAAGERGGGALWWRFFTSAPAVARVAREQGDPTLAWRLVRDGLPGGAATAPGDAFYAQALELQHVAATLASDAGDLAAARAWLGAHDRWLAWGGAVLGRAEGQLAWAACHRAAGDPALARRHAAAALEHASNPRQPLALLAAHRLLGELAVERGRSAEALGHLEAALALADACETPYERALTLLALAELRRAEGRPREAGPLLAEAGAICAPLGAARALARADALAGETGPAAARAPRWATRAEQAFPSAPAPQTPWPGAARPEALTRREQEVAALLAQGRTNRQIAEALTITEGTARNHVEHILGKLGLQSRWQVADWARGGRLPGTGSD